MSSFIETRNKLLPCVDIIGPSARFNLEVLERLIDRTIAGMMSEIRQCHCNDIGKWCAADNIDCFKIASEEHIIKFEYGDKETGTRSSWLEAATFATVRLLVITTNPPLRPPGPSKSGFLY